jgi:hypothetical protein
MMAVNDGGVAPILAQKYCTQPTALTAENLLHEIRRHLIAIAVNRLRPRRLLS